MTENTADHGDKIRQPDPVEADAPERDRHRFEQHAENASGQEYEPAYVLLRLFADTKNDTITV